MTIKEMRQMMRFGKIRNALMVFLVASAFAITIPVLQAVFAEPVPECVGEACVASAELSVAVDETLTLVVHGDIQINPVVAQNDGFASASGDVTVGTNNAVGANLRVSMDSSTPSNSLYGTVTPTNSIAATGSEFGETLDDNSWGYYAYNKAAPEPSPSWQAMPDYGSPATIFDEGEIGSGSSEPGEVTYTFVYGVKIDYGVVPDVYVGKILYTATTNEVPPDHRYLSEIVADYGIIYMQELTPQLCQLANYDPTNNGDNDNNRVVLADARDNHTYYIQKTPDTATNGQGDLCWMTTNLAYAGGQLGHQNNNTFGDAISLPAPTTSGNLGGSSTNAYILPGWAIPTPPSGGVSFTELPNAPSTISGGEDGAQYGYLYNFCATMGGQSSACVDSSTWINQIDIDPTVNICPAGWRLPTATGSGSEFWALRSALNGGLGNTDFGLRGYWYGVYAGYYSSSFAETNTVGRYASSTVSSSRADSSSILYMNPTTAAHDYGNARNRAVAVRCVQ